MSGDQHSSTSQADYGVIALHLAAAAAVAASTNGPSAADDDGTSSQPPPLMPWSDCCSALLTGLPIVQALITDGAPGEIVFAQVRRQPTPGGEQLEQQHAEQQPQQQQREYTTIRVLNSKLFVGVKNIVGGLQFGQHKHCMVLISPAKCRLTVIRHPFSGGEKRPTANSEKSNNDDDDDPGNSNNFTVLAVIDDFGRVPGLKQEVDPADSGVIHSKVEFPFDALVDPADPRRLFLSSAKFPLTALTFSENSQTVGDYYNFVTASLVSKSARPPKVLHGMELTLVLPKQSEDDGTRRMKEEKRKVQQPKMVALCDGGNHPGVHLYDMARDETRFFFTPSTVGSTSGKRAVRVCYLPRDDSLVVFSVHPHEISLYRGMDSLLRGIEKVDAAEPGTRAPQVKEYPLEYLCSLGTLVSGRMTIDPVSGSLIVPFDDYWCEASSVFDLEDALNLTILEEQSTVSRPPPQHHHHCPQICRKSRYPSELLPVDPTTRKRFAGKVVFFGFV